MRRLALLVLFLAPGFAPAADFDPKPLDALVERALKEMEVPGAAVVVVQDDRVIYLRAFGVREKGKPESVTPDTVFAIASCTKAFTSTLVAMMTDDGKLKWDDKVHDHLDYFRLSDELADREVTLRDLLCHRTGMPRHDMLWSGSPTWDSEAVIRRWVKGKPSTSFRSTWEYSNVPFTTAGVIAGKVAGTDWQTATKSRIFAPLGMKASGCTAREAVAADDHATPHYHRLDKTIAAIKWDNLDSARGAGSINSTARDLGNWLRFQLAAGQFDGKRLVSEKAIKETHTAQMLFRPEGRFRMFFPEKAGRFHAYGLGWFVHDYRGHDCVSHGGTLTGFRAQCMLVPAKKAGVFVVCNLNPSVFPEAVAKSALDLVLGMPTEDWLAEGKATLEKLDAQAAERLKKRASDRKPDTKPSLELKEYAGNYDEPAYGRAEVTRDNDKLGLKWGKFTFRLEHYHYDTFTAVPVEPKDEIVSTDRSAFDVQFRLGTNGQVEGMKFLDQEFKKAAAKK
jgi:CubicO group peptidase (beta-lactamase class C family)